MSNTDDSNINSSHERFPLFQILLPAGSVVVNQVVPMIRCDANSCFRNLVDSGFVEIRTCKTKISLGWFMTGYWYK